MLIQDVIVAYPEQGGLLGVPLPAMPAESPAVSGRIVKLMPTGPDEQPMVMEMPAWLKGVSVQGPGDGGGVWMAMFECEMTESTPDEPPGEVHAQIFTLW